MKWCRIEVDERAVFGELEGDVIAALDGPPYDGGVRTGATYPLAAARFLPPVAPANFYAAGLNFRDHIAWVNAHFGVSFKVPTTAELGYRSPNALVGHDHAVVLPADSTGSFQFEGELVLVVGRRAKNVSEAAALNCIAGCTLGNDMSERAWQFSDRTFWRAKNCDTFKPMGPFVVAGLDPMDQEIEVRVNGVVVSKYCTKDMLFSAAHFIARTSRYATLHPGDVIWLGSDGPTLPGLDDGDVVEVSNAAIGVLRNRIVREGARQ